MPMRYLDSTWKSTIIRVFQFTQKLSQELLIIGASAHNQVRVQ